MRFWRRREGEDTTDAWAPDAESVPTTEDFRAEAALPESVPEAVETEGRGGWLSRLRAGMSRSSARLTQGINTIFTRRRLDDEALEELEELLISSDMGLGVAGEVADALRKTRFNQEFRPKRFAPPLPKR